MALDILTVSESARLLEVTDETFRRYERAGRIAPVHLTSAGWRFFRRDDVLRLAAERARTLREKHERVRARRVR